MVTANRTAPSITGRILTALGIGVGLLLLLLLVVNLLFSAVYANRIIPGVSMNGISLSGLTVNQAADAISKSVRYPETGTVLLVAGEKNWSASPVQLGVYLDPLSSAQTAFNVGRRGSLSSLLVQRFSSMANGVEIFPSFIYDQKTSLSYLEKVAAQINQPIREASLSINGTDIVVNQGQAGYVLDYATSLDSVTRQIQTMQDGIVQLSVITTNPVILDASAQGELARGILSQPFTFAIPSGAGSGEPIQLQPDSLAQMLMFEKVTGTDGTNYQVSINKPLVSAFLQTLENSFNAQPENARFYFDDDTRQLVLVTSATIGRTLNIEQSVAGIDNAIHNGAHSADLVFDTQNPAVTDSTTAADLGITELVYAYTSYFRGSIPERVQNIKTASSRFHGLLIAPGDTLSMSDVLGDISLDNGYAEALIILGDQTITGVGGGVCQVSTTLFRTAFYAGFPILERHPHAYRVGYYEQTSSGHNQNLAGLDATVFVPLVDLKFRNDTAYWLLMETYVSSSNYSLTWKFYSTKDGRVVTYDSTGLTDVVKAPDTIYRENPDLPQGTKKQVDYAVDGANVTVTRLVTLNGNVLYDDRFVTHYQAWAEAWEYGPGTEGMPPPPPMP